MTRGWWPTASLAAFCLLMATTVFAQGRPTVFVHGFTASAGDWAATAERLRGVASIEPHIPTLAWQDPIQTQARNLQATPEFLTLPSSTVAIGHSNGGLVAREWGRIRKLDGIVTIGTPHRGAPIVGNLVRWYLFSGTTLDAINRVLSSFGVPSNWWWMSYFIEGALHWTSDFSVWSFTNLVSTLGVKRTVPVTFDMVPTSDFLSGMNTGASLAREAIDVPNRVGIVSIARHYFYAGPARAIAPDNADAIAGVMYGTASALLMWGNFVLFNSAPTDIAANDQAMALIGLGFQILSIDPYYCRLVSSVGASDCAPNDGVVPIDSQAYPNAPNLLIGLDDSGPAHKQERQQSDDVLYHALTTFMHVPPRNGPMPGPPPPPPPGAGQPPGPGPGDEPPTDSGGGGSSPPVTIASGELGPNEGLNPDDTLTSSDGRLHLTYQGDGNLVLYDVRAGDSWVPLWASDTAGTAAGRVAMQGDGNLVIYDASGTALWSSDSSLNHPGARLAVQNDGNVVIYDVDGTPLWATDTFVS